MQYRITKIFFDKKTKLSNVLFDSNDALNISAELVVKFNLKRGVVIDQTLYTQICHEQEILQAKNEAIRYISYRPKTIWEVENKLYSLKFRPEAIAKTINFLIEFGYLDDEKFAVKYINEKIKLKKSSFKKLERELLRKGIKKDILENVFLQFERSDIEKINALQHARRKYCSIKYKSEFERIQKTINYLIQKGFSFDLAKEAVDEISKELDSAHPEGLEPPTL